MEKAAAQPGLTVGITLLFLNWLFSEKRPNDWMTLTRHNKVFEELLKHFQFNWIFFSYFFSCIFNETFVLITQQHP